MMASDQQFLVKLVDTRMPFGKFEGRLLIELPEEYLAWFRRKGWPKGKLGQMLEIIYETRINGDTDIFHQLRRECIKNGLILATR